jgi:epidermal growth factor receptor substrate 15
MHLIRASMDGQLPSIPTTLPPGLYELASDQPLPHQFTGQGPARNAPALGPFPAVFALQPQLAWDVTPTEKATADMRFDGLDKQKRGYVESDVVVPFMLQSKLPKSDLASIWLASLTYPFSLSYLTTVHRDLVDLNDDGRLTRDCFAVAFHLIRERLNGNEIPATLSASLMPPSMRAAATNQEPQLRPRKRPSSAVGVAKDAELSTGSHTPPSESPPLPDEEAPEGENAADPDSPPDSEPDPTVIAAEILKEQGNDSFKSGRYGEAIDLYSKAIGAFPALPPRLYPLPLPFS